MQYSDTALCACGGPPAVWLLEEKLFFLNTIVLYCLYCRHAMYADLNLQHNCRPAQSGERLVNMSFTSLSNAPKQNNEPIHRIHRGLDRSDQRSIYPLTAAILSESVNIPRF
jgi:hypothetical protein